MSGGSIKTQLQRSALAKRLRALVMHRLITVARRDLQNIYKIQEK